MNRRTFITALGSTGLAAIIQGCQPVGQPGGALASDMEGLGVSPADDDSTTAFPAIDRAAPAAFATATFAMG